MSDKTYDPRVKAALEYGPLLAFMVGYWLVKDRVFTVGGVEYSGFIAITAVFVVSETKKPLGLIHIHDLLREGVS